LGGETKKKKDKGKWIDSKQGTSTKENVKKKEKKVRVRMNTSVVNLRKKTGKLRENSQGEKAPDTWESTKQAYLAQKHRKRQS